MTSDKHTHEAALTTTQYTEVVGTSMTDEEDFKLQRDEFAAELHKYTDRKIVSYTFRNTSVLYNSLGIADNHTLDRLEAHIVTPRIESARTRLSFLESHKELCSFSTLRSIHKHLFQDLYPAVAGHPRHINIQKPFEGKPFRFPYFSDVNASAHAIFSEIWKDTRLIAPSSSEAFLDAFASYYVRLYNVHTFREGNTRTLGILFEEIAKRAGYSCHLLDMESLADKASHYQAIYSAMKQNDPTIFRDWLQQNSVLPSRENETASSIRSKSTPLSRSTISESWVDTLTASQFNARIDNLGLILSRTQRNTASFRMTEAEREADRTVKSLGLL